MLWVEPHHEDFPVHNLGVHSVIKYAATDIGIASDAGVCRLPGAKLSIEGKVSPSVHHLGNDQSQQVHPPVTTAAQTPVKPRQYDSRAALCSISSWPGSKPHSRHLLVVPRPRTGIERCCKAGEWFVITSDQSGP